MVVSHFLRQRGQAIADNTVSALLYLGVTVAVGWAVNHFAPRWGLDAKVALVLAWVVALLLAVAFSLLLKPTHSAPSGETSESNRPITVSPTVSPEISPSVSFGAPTYQAPLYEAPKVEIKIENNPQFTQSQTQSQHLADDQPLQLTVKIVEAFVIPNRDRTADCFLKVSVHNNTKVDCSNPLQYALSLKINEQEYSDTSRLDLHAHQFVQYKTVPNYGEDGERFEEEKELHKEGLRPNVETAKDFLVKGKPLIGWLGLQVHYLPEWKYHEELIRHDENADLNEDTGEIVYRYEPVYEYTPTLQTLSSLKLVVIDPYQQGWSDETSSFNPKRKRIEKRKNKGDERARPTTQIPELDITFDKIAPEFVDATKVFENGVTWPCKLYRVAVTNHCSSPITRLLAKGVKNLTEGRTYPPLHLRITGKPPTEKEVRPHKGEPQFWDVVEKKDSEREWARLMETDIPGGHLLPIPSDFTITASCDDGLSVTKRVRLGLQENGDVDFQLTNL